MSKALLGIVLVLLGGTIAVAGIVLALLPLIGIYAGNIENALDQPDGAEQGASDSMLRGVLIGALGIPFLLAGSVLLKVSLVQRLHRAARKNADSVRRQATPRPDGPAATGEVARTKQRHERKPK